MKENFSSRLSSLIKNKDNKQNIKTSSRNFDKIISKTIASPQIRKKDDEFTLEKSVKIEYVEKPKYSRDDDENLRELTKSGIYSISLIIN